MVNLMVKYLLYQSSYLEVFLSVLIYFCFLYFLLAPLFLFSCKFLERKGVLNKIVLKKIPKGQILFEIKNSVVSIFIFGASGIPLIFLIRNNYIEILEDNFFNIILGVLILNIWNEIHFFIIHRIMHIPYMMKNIHKTHHKSLIPTVYSVYSFHWFEALLLSSVPLTICSFITFSPIAIFIYPFTSVLLNYFGHCNFRFGNGKEHKIFLFGTNHNEHHNIGRKNYGFVTGLLDKLNNIIKNKKR